MKTIIKFFKTVFIILFLWIFITTSYQKFTYPSLTETEVFLNIPNSFMLNFKK